MGVAVYKVGLLWPLEPEGLAEFAAGKQELFFVEDKAAFEEMLTTLDALKNTSTPAEIAAKDRKSVV